MKLGSRANQHSFAMVPQSNMARSAFDRSFARKTTFNFDLLVPCYVEEVLPGDTINLNVKSFARLAPQVKPLMDNMYLDFFFFFVPNRLVWDNWQRFNGEQPNPGDTTDFLVPTILAPTGGFAVQSMFDYFGIPVGVDNFTINALYARAYNLIYNEWFRDQNLINRAPVFKGDGPDAATSYSLLYRAKKHDYFTSGLPWPQKGVALSLPLGASAPVISNGLVTRFSAADNSFVNKDLNGRDSGAGYVFNAGGAPDGTNRSLKFGNQTGLIADLTAATAATINSLRQAFQLQSLLELDARGGTRYVEILKAHFDVVSPDYRLQRPEFLSSASTPFSQHPIPQTSSSTEDSPQGNLSAFSTHANMDNRVGFSKSFTEHGMIIGLVNARADVTYQQGLNRMFSRRTRWEYFWPKLQEIGEQAVLCQEIYITTNPATNTTPFCYQERYAEYKYRPSEITGFFRSTSSLSLDVWHLAQDFGALPGFNQEFIESRTPIDRILVVNDPTSPNILMDLWFQQRHVRPMATYSVPAGLGRF